MTGDDATAALCSEIISTTVDLLGAAPDDVVLAPPDTVAKTPSGKIRRAASREIYEKGRIGARPRALWWELARLRLRGAMPSARRAGRAAAALAFAAYAWALFAVLGLSVVVLLALLPRAPWRWKVARGAVRLLARLTGTTVTVHGLDRLPARPCVAVANHSSWLDGVLLPTVLPTSFRFVAAEVFQRRALSGFVLKRLGTEFVERYEREHGVADTDRLAALVRAGQRLAIFPEGHLARAPGCGRSTWARSWSPHKPAPQSSLSVSAGPGRSCGPVTGSRDGEPSTSPSVSRSSPMARTGRRQSSCSAPHGTPFCISQANRTSNETHGGGTACGCRQPDADSRSDRLSPRRTPGFS